MRKTLRWFINLPAAFVLSLCLAGFATSVQAISVVDEEGCVWSGTLGSGEGSVTCPDGSSASASLNDDGEIVVDGDDGDDGGGGNAGAVIAGVLVVGALAALGIWWYMSKHGTSAQADGSIEQPLTDSTSIALSPKVLEEGAWDEDAIAGAGLQDLTAAEVSLRYRF